MHKTKRTEKVVLTCFPTCHPQHLCDRGSLECPLSDPSNAHHGSLGPSSVHPHSAKAASDEEAGLRARSAPVGTIGNWISAAVLFVQ